MEESVQEISTRMTTGRGEMFKILNEYECLIDHVKASNPPGQDFQMQDQSHQQPTGLGGPLLEGQRRGRGMIGGRRARQRGVDHWRVLTRPRRGFFYSENLSALRTTDMTLKDEFGEVIAMETFMGWRSIWRRMGRTTSSPKTSFGKVN